MATNSLESTSERPPTLLLQVNEVLLGDTSSGVAQAVWTVCSGIWCSVGEEARVKRWKSTHLKAPPVGERLLLAGEFNRSRKWFVTDQELRTSFTPEKREALIAHLKEEQSKWLPEEKVAQTTRWAEARAAVRDDELMRVVNAESRRLLEGAGARQ